MPTQHEWRLTVLIPDARKAALVSWWDANMGGRGAQTFAQGLSASGNPPYTHWWFSAGLTLPELRLIAVRLLNLAGIPLPGDWDTMTRAEKKAWLQSQIGPIRAATGIRIRVGDNEADWDNPVQTRVDEGLQVG